MSKELPWLRLYSDIVDNEKIRLLAFEDRWHYIAILSLKRQGILDSNPSLIHRKIAVKLGLQLSEVDEVKRRLYEVELIDENFQPVGWESKQFTNDSSKERTRKYRENLRKKECDGVVTSQESHSDITVTAQDTDTDTDTDVEEERHETDACASDVRNEKHIPDCPQKQIINLYLKNIIVGIYPRIWNGCESASLRSRWREDKGRQDLDWWDRFFKHIAKSDWLMGRINGKDGKPFQISLPWIVKNENFKKIINGNYDNR